MIQNDIIKTLNAVINALDSITVTGQYNRGTLYGSIETLKEIMQKLSADQQVHESIVHQMPANQAIGEE